MEDKAVRVLVDKVDRLQFSIGCVWCPSLNILSFTHHPKFQLQTTVSWQGCVLDIGILSADGSLVGAIVTTRNSGIRMLQQSSLEWFLVSTSDVLKAVLKAATRPDFIVEAQESHRQLCGCCVEKAKKVTHQCSYCTAGSATCSVQPMKLCVHCRSTFVHLCSNCLKKTPLSTCYLCTPREHVCLSKCHRGCVLDAMLSKKEISKAATCKAPLALGLANFFQSTNSIWIWIVWT